MKDLKNGSLKTVGTLVLAGGDLQIKHENIPILGNNRMTMRVPAITQQNRSKIKTASFRYVDIRTK